MTSRPSAARLAAVLLGAFAFGVLAAWAKGQNTDGVAQVSQLRNALGNLSTPWLLVAFFAGLQWSRLRDGAVVGLAATLCALAGFYLLSTLVENLGGHGFLGDLRLELSGNRAYFEGGVITGPIFGALGALLSQWRRRPTARTSLLVGGLLIAEPLVMLALGPVRHHVLSAQYRPALDRADHSRLGPDSRLGHRRVGGLRSRVCCRRGCRCLELAKGVDTKKLSAHTSL